MIEQIGYVDPVSVCEVALKEHLLVTDMEQTVEEQDPREREQVDSLDEHEPVHEEVVADLCRHVEQARWDEAVGVAEVVKAHHLL